MYVNYVEWYSINNPILHFSTVRYASGVDRGQQPGAPGGGTGEGRSKCPERVVWLGWDEVAFNNLTRTRSPPDVLLLHCGGNDLRKVRGLELAAVMKQDL